MIAALVALYLGGAIGLALSLLDTQASDVRECERAADLALASAVVAGLCWPALAPMIAHRFLRACRGLPEDA